ncbi:unnamed protein product [Cuscuta epithymum]|uniref:TCP domain-containing protein n=1 Tax=Cuscuta epithymum TaxID=186058 RepID=A0AAV0CR01_9ASTE|nr:unnamed protein product [Cuscuta epithymum]
MKNKNIERESSFQRGSFRRGVCQAFINGASITSSMFLPIRTMDNQSAASHVVNPAGATASEPNQWRYRGKRIRLPTEIADRVISLTQQLRFRTDGHTVMWLLQQAEPAIVVAQWTANYPPSAAAAFQPPIPVPGGDYTENLPASNITAAPLLITSPVVFGGTESPSCCPVITTPSLVYQPPPYSWGYPIPDAYQPPYRGEHL